MANDFPELTQDDAPQSQTPDLTAPAAAPPMPPEVINERVKRADMALGDQSPGVAALTDSFNSGQEGVIRQQVAGQATAEHQQAKLDTINAIVHSNTPITGEHIDHLMKLGQNVPGTDPETSIEDRFAQNYVGMAVAGEPEKNLVFQSAFEKQPDETNQHVQLGQALASNQAIIKNFREESEAAYHQIPWINTSPDDIDQEDKLGDMFKSILTGGFRDAYYQRNLLTSTPLMKTDKTSLLPGSNMMEQVQGYLLLPHDQLLPALKATLGPGSEIWKEAPGAAMTMIRAIEKYSVSDSYVDNALAISNVASVIPVGTGLRALGRIINGREVPSLALQSGLQAAQDVLNASPKAPLSNAKRLENASRGFDRANATNTANDILSSPSTPPTPRTYVPGASIEDLTGKPSRLGEVKIGADGKPQVFNTEGAEVQTKSTPEVGHYPISVQKAEPVPTYTGEAGKATPYRTDADGHTYVETGRGSGEQRTIFVNKKDYENLSEVLDDNPKKDLRLIHDTDGSVFINDRNKNPTASRGIGKRQGTVVPAERISDTPKEGLYAIHLPEGNDKIAFEDFAKKVTAVDAGQPYKVSVGAKIGETVDVEARRAVADIVKSTAERDPQDGLSKMGMHEPAAQVAATRDLQQAVNQIVPQGVEALRRKLPSLFSPQAWFNNASSLSRDMAERIYQRVLQDNAAITAALNNPTRVERLTNEAFTQAVESAKNAVKNDPRWNANADAIRDQKILYDAQSNTYSVETRFGKKDGSMFDTSAQADNYRREQYGLGSAATVQQEGNKFYLSHIQNIDETYRAVRDGLVVAGNKTPQGIINTILNAATGKLKLGASIRSSRYTVSDFQHTQRVVATHAGSELEKLVNEIGEPLAALNKGEKQELERFLTHQRDFKNSDGTRGTFSQSAHDFEQSFFDMHQKMPSDKQLAAYDSYIRLNDLDWMLRAFQLHRDKARMGIRNYQITVPLKDALGAESNVKTEFFNGKEVINPRNPSNKANANIYVVPDKRMTERYSDTIADRVMDQKIKSGEWRVVQVANPREKPLQAATGYKDDIHFIVTDAFEDKPLELGDGLNYQPGGHVINRDPYYLKVPIISPGHNGRLTHFGDQTFKSFATEREANMWAARYNTAREHMLAGRDKELQQMFDAGQFPETMPEFKQVFTGGGLNADAKMPFVVTKEGRTTLQSNTALRAKYEGLAEQWDAYNLTQSYNKDFLAERDQVLNTITGKEGQWENTASRLYDPYTSMQRGLSQIIRERWVGDYKTQAAESWIAEHWDLFPQDTLPREKLEQNPWYWINHAAGSMDAGLAKTEPAKYTAAMVSRQNILNFLGVRDEAGAVMQGLEQKLLDYLEPKIGKDWTETVETNILPAIKNSAAYVRRAAFHAVIGLYNPVQLIQQAQDLGRIIAISPVHGSNGAVASGLIRFFRYTEDPAILSTMFDKAANLGWDRGHIEEAYNAWKSSGVHNIGGEVAALNDVVNPPIFKGRFGQFVDKGQLFFKAGESLTRDTSFFTAYREWKAVNPNTKLTNRNIGEIMNRFDNLTMNMTRASNAGYNEGILSIPTQFWNWNARFAEQMVGNTLTAGEKARALTAFSVMYGIPATLGGATFGATHMLGLSTDDIRQYAIAHGYNVNNKYFEALTTGLPAMLANILTGHHTDFQRFSPEANQLKDIIDGKKSFLADLAGASGGFASNVLGTLYPFARWSMSALSGRPNDFPITRNDFLNVAENISSLNNLEKAWVGFHLGKLFSKNDRLIDNQIDTFESVMLGLGLNPKRDSDKFLQANDAASLKSMQDKMRPAVLQQWANGNEAAARGDFALANQYFTRAKTLSSVAQFSLKDEAKLREQAMSGSAGDMIDNSEMRWRENAPTLRNLPQLKQYLDNYQGHYR